jgi:hypothetical protein
MFAGDVQAVSITQSADKINLYPIYDSQNAELEAKVRCVTFSQHAVQTK